MAWRGIDRFGKVSEMLSYIKGDKKQQRWLTRLEKAIASNTLRKLVFKKGADWVYGSMKEIPYKKCRVKVQ